jgi:capsule polysaccharide export protein KpsE/RkpR
MCVVQSRLEMCEIEVKNTRHQLHACGNEVAHWRERVAHAEDALEEARRKVDELEAQAQGQGSLIRQLQQADMTNAEALSRYALAWLFR